MAVRDRSLVTRQAFWRARWVISSNSSKLKQQDRALTLTCDTAWRGIVGTDDKVSIRVLQEVHMKTIRMIAVAAAVLFAGNSLALHVAQAQQSGVTRTDLQRHDLAFVVDHEVQLEAVEPSHAGLAARGQAVEDLMAVDAAIVADGELG